MCPTWSWMYGWIAKLICFDIVSDPSTAGAYMKIAESRIPELKTIQKKEKINRLLNEIIDE